MFAWQEVETELFKLYHSMNVLGGEQDIMVSANTYYNKKSFGLKLKIVKELAKKVCANKYIDWESLKCNLEYESNFRNSLAHSPVQPEKNQDGSVSLVLGDPIFLPLSLKEIPAIAHEYDTNTCLDICNSFKRLAQQINTARSKIPCKFKDNQLILSTEHRIE